MIGALGTFAGDDLAEARKVMTGSKVADMVNRLSLTHQHLLMIDTYCQLEEAS